MKENKLAKFLASQAQTSLPKFGFFCIFWLFLHSVCNLAQGKENFISDASEQLQKVGKNPKSFFCKFSLGTLQLNSLRICNLATLNACGRKASLFEWLVSSVD